jgi:O-antigen ligase
VSSLLPSPSALQEPLKRTFSSFWLVGWAIALSLGWLLPNHYLPWPSFHLEAWVAVLLCVAMLVVLLRTPANTGMSGLALVAAIVALVPMIQYVSGMHAIMGPALVATVYLSGFCLSVLVGMRWESATRSQLADGLFLAIGIAAILSVGLQLHQWLQLDRLFLWDMGASGGRPFANFGQPNLLATFLLWGVLAAAWGVQRNYLGPRGAMVLALYLLFGVALTGSRTAWVAVVLLMVAAWFWRGLWRSPRTPWLVMSLGVYLWICLYAKTWMGEFLLLGATEDLARIASETRPQVWAMFFDALLQQPWTGYGWQQIGMAHQAVAVDHPPLYVLFSHSHNLFLDLMLACGVPLGLLLCGALLWWFWRRFRAVKNAEDVILLLFVVVVANHAMLEYPLSYAYFLLPLGLMIGALDVRLGARSWRVGGAAVAVCLGLALVLFLAMAIRDYARVESSYRALRFEFADIPTSASREPPDVLVLTHLREMIRYARFEPHRNMSSEELAWMLSVARLYPSAGIIHKMAAALAWNHRPEEAQLWLRRLCKMTQPAACEAVRRAWAHQAVTDPEIRDVPWPETATP